MKRLLPFLLLTLIAPAARAQSTMDQRRAAEPDGLVEIENPAGSIHVVGWDKNEVTVTGSLGARAEGLEFSGGARRTSISRRDRGQPARRALRPRDPRPRGQPARDRGLRRHHPHRGGERRGARPRP